MSELERRIARIERELGIDHTVESFAEEVRDFVDYSPRYDLGEISDTEPKATLLTDVPLTGNAYDTLSERFREVCAESGEHGMVVKVYGLSQEGLND